jgi:hypothetical protein
VKNQNDQNGIGENGTAQHSNAQDQKHILETTAQAIGSTLGSLAVKTGLAKPSGDSEQLESSGKHQQVASPEKSETHRNNPNGNVVSMAGHKPGVKRARKSKKKK